MRFVKRMERVNLAAQVVKLICAGRKVSEIRQVLGLTAYELDHAFNFARSGAMLPYGKKECKDRAKETLHNLQKWVDLEQAIADLKTDYLASTKDLWEV